MKGTGCPPGTSFQTRKYRRKLASPETGVGLAAEKPGICLTQRVSNCKRLSMVRSAFLDRWMMAGALTGHSLHRSIKRVKRNCSGLSVNKP